MLQITIPAIEKWDSKNQEFIYEREQTLKLEHSLVSLSKWESKWHKPFISKEPKTTEETIDYIKCMTLTQNVNPEVYNNIPDRVISQINDYIDDPMTATVIQETDGRANNGEKVTSEVIYYWMIALNIPPEYQKWHINRLLTLIKICNIKSKPPRKMSMRERMSQNARLNAARRNKYKSRG